MSPAAQAQGCAMIQSSPLLHHQVVRFDAAHRVRRPGHWLTAFAVVAAMLASAAIIATGGNDHGGAKHRSQPFEHFPG